MAPRTFEACWKIRHDEVNLKPILKYFLKETHSKAGAMVALLFLVLVLVSEHGWTAELTPQERRGHQIFRQGTSASGQPIMARMGGGGTTVNAALLPCINCHGPDARGRTEGGVIWWLDYA